MTTILSTKKLSTSQRERLLNAKLSVVHVDFIATETLPFQTPQQPIENAIFTSQSGVNAVFNKGIEIKSSFCVGKHTEKLLIENKASVNYTGANAEELGNYLVTNKTDNTYYYFCAQERLDTLPNILTQNNINWHEIPVYKTIKTPKKYDQQFDGVLFFSPSGVESFFNTNPIPVHSFCIGNTTAKALHKYTQNYTVASKPSVVNVLIKAIKHFNSHD